MIGLRLQRERHIIPHVSAALLGACLACCLRYARQSLCKHTASPLLTRTHTHRKVSRGALRGPCVRHVFTGLSRLHLAPEKLQVGKLLLLPLMLAAVMTIKPSCRGSKSKEQRTQAKQTSLINATKRNLKNKVHRLEEHKGHPPPHPPTLKSKNMMSSVWSLSLFSVSLPPSAGEQRTQTPGSTGRRTACLKALFPTSLL